ncbi:multidrug efflux SMR transporter [Paucilactobacillus suebicus]|uniref:Membrane transporter n=1 Tax=Paucilactobacillus suebicus DSM 5007 = KCTC 3549 TaxID=1423807 RepID=A0A0R1W1Z1_9LACO|nr:multidrug efflux SMR transporter [Paucilactobacillus suebicus]KRM11889.1 membrane transporter [Paucilactobacillus suebicus DSM 5007 = KCTC 3549]
MGYLYLGLAVGGEIAGTSFLKYSNGFSKVLPSIGVVIGYILCFYFLSLAFRSIDLSIAYAMWSGVGTVAITLISVFALHESINLPSIIGITLILLGSVILNLFGSAH